MASGLGSASGAEGADPVDVESLIHQGVELRKQGHDQESLTYFKRAYELERSPRTAAQLGLGELAMGYSLRAEQHLAEALASPNHLWIKRNRVKLEAAHQQALGAIGHLDVRGPVGTEISVNGQAVGTLPLPRPLLVAEGVIELAARATGFADNRRTLQVKGGQSDVLVIALTPLRDLDAVAGSAPINAAEPVTPVPRLGESSNLRESASPPAAGRRGAPAWLRGAAWTASGLAVAAVGLGGYGLWQLHKSESDFNDRILTGTSERACSTAAPDRGAAGCADVYAEVKSAETTARIGLPAAAVFATAAIVGFLWSAEGKGGARETATSPHGTVAAAIGDGRLGVQWHLCF